MFQSLFIALIYNIWSLQTTLSPSEKSILKAIWTTFS